MAEACLRAVPPSLGSFLNSLLTFGYTTVGLLELFQRMLCEVEQETVKQKAMDLHSPRNNFAKVPITFEEVVKKEEWRKAMKEEIKQGSVPRSYFNDRNNLCTPTLQ
ncbi:hypothetical protein MUK42_30054 [Musa troglodytarum]|uniref:Uncharacterized protein n=1 Tax=Musa troglodytarum TaxID=320322 RepID=A0A9E7F3D1_9LILI|nr:hypothetical protein MUK42_30054 [Musa troglodytarum]